MSRVRHVRRSQESSLSGTVISKAFFLCVWAFVSDAQSKRRCPFRAKRWSTSGSTLTCEAPVLDCAIGLRIYGLTTQRRTLELVPDRVVHLANGHIHHVYGHNSWSLRLRGSRKSWLWAICREWG